MLNSGPQYPSTAPSATVSRCERILSSASQLDKILSELEGLVNRLTGGNAPERIGTQAKKEQLVVSEIWGVFLLY